MYVQKICMEMNYIVKNIIILKLLTETIQRAGL